jgi:uncharacterized lipoprotein YajG
MPKTSSAVILLAALGLLGACETAEPTVYREVEPPKGSKAAEIETLQKATVASTGNQAWEVVQISNIQRDAKSVKWNASTRSRYLACGADPDGSNSYCDPATPPGA